MKYIVGVVLFLALLLVGALRYGRVKNIFDPLIIFLFLQFLRYSLPLVALDGEDFFGCYVPFSVENVLSLFFYEFVFVLFAILPFSFGRTKKQSISIKRSDEETGHNFKRLTAITAFSIGLLAKVYVIQKLGGFFYVVSHMSESYSKQSSGFGYISLLYGLMLVGILIELQRFKILKNKRDLVIAVFMSAIYMGSYLVYSSRGPAFQLIIIWICFFAIYNKGLPLKKLFSPLLILLGIVAGVLSMAVVNMRNSGNDLTQYDSVSLMLGGIIKEFSRSGRDIYCYNEMSDIRWYGMVFLNLLYMVVPSGIFGNKPPLDDGLYLINAMHGNVYSPNTPRFDMAIQSGSVPFATQGLMYVNFGLFGVILGGFVTGLLLKAISNYFYSSRRKNPFFFAYLFFYFCFMFQITPLLISSFITNVAVFIPFEIYASQRNKTLSLFRYNKAYVIGSGRTTRSNLPDNVID